MIWFGKAGRKTEPGLRQGKRAWVDGCRTAAKSSSYSFQNKDWCIFLRQVAPSLCITRRAFRF